MPYGNFVTTEDFNTLPFSIPNVENVQQGFNTFVTEQQEDVLRRLLGNSLFEAFKAGLDVDQDADDPGTTEVDESEDEVDQIWLDLKNGKDFTYHDHAYKWYGMKKMLVPFIYSRWLKHTADDHTENGIVQSVDENSVIISPAQRISAAYNKFVDLVGRPSCGVVKDNLFSFLYLSEDVYEDYIDGHSSIKAYLDRHFYDFGYMNRFGF